MHISLYIFRGTFYVPYLICSLVMQELSILEMGRCHCCRHTSMTRAFLRILKQEWPQAFRQKRKDQNTRGNEWKLPTRTLFSSIHVYTARLLACFMRRVSVVSPFFFVFHAGWLVCLCDVVLEKEKKKSPPLCRVILWKWAFLTLVALTFVGKQDFVYCWNVDFVFLPKVAALSKYGKNRRR